MHESCIRINFHGSRAGAALYIRSSAKGEAPSQGGGLWNYNGGKEALEGGWKKTLAATGWRLIVRRNLVEILIDASMRHTWGRRIKVGWCTVQ